MEAFGIVLLGIWERRVRRVNGYRLVLHCILGSLVPKHLLTKYPRKYLTKYPYHFPVEFPVDIFKGKDTDKLVFIPH